MEKRILLSSPTMHGEELDFVHEAFDKNWIAPLGFNCDGFENEMVAYLQKKSNDLNIDLHAFASVSGTSAIHLALILAGIKDGDEVICSDMTFAATVNPVVYQKAVPVFVDSENETWNMDPEALLEAIKKHPKAKAVIIAHLYGTPSKMDEIVDICKSHNLILIEDAAEALSSTYKGRACGTFGDYNALSFNGNKIITCSGGGMLLTKDKASRDRALFFATQARDAAPWYQHTEIGYNYRLSNVSAGIGRGQLIHVDEHRQLKEHIYMTYKEAFKSLPVKMNPYMDDTVPNFWLSCFTINKDCNVTFMDVLNKLNEANVESRPIWKPMHMQPVYKDFDFVSTKSEPVNEDIFNSGLCLPSDIKMTDEELNYVIDAIKDCF